MKLRLPKQNTLSLSSSKIEHTIGLGSGYLKADGPFQIVAMKKQVQTSNMHQRRFRERERFSNKSSQALPECIIPALYMSCLTCFLAHCCMLLFWNNCLICSPKI